MRFAPIVLTLVALAGPGQAGAQTFRVPPIEIGVQGGGLIFLGDGIFTEAAIGPHITLNVSPRNAIELSSDMLREGGGLYGLYFLQYKRSIWRPSDTHSGTFFATAGLGGYFERRHVPERRFARPDGSIAIFPAHTAGELSGFELGKIGVGVEQPINRHASIRLDADVFGAFAGALGFRFTAGLAIPLGDYHAN